MTASRASGLLTVPKSIASPVDCTSAEQLVRELREALLDDLATHGWVKTGTDSAGEHWAPPASSHKETIRRALLAARKPILQRYAPWLKRHEPTMRGLLANGRVLDPSRIDPYLELCETQAQRNIFRYFRFYWSSPYSEYVGRRLRFLVRDASLPNHPVIGLLALGSSIIHIPERDRWLGWDKATRTERIGYMMDIYALGAIPPYNELLGGKLISLLAASNEVRAFYRRRYAGKTTLARNRELTDLVLLVTTSLYGRRSSQYNRLNYEGQPLFKFIGLTSGYGSMQISSSTFDIMRRLLDECGITQSHEFGKGPNWRIRVIRDAVKLAGLNPELILRHGFARGIFAVPLANNFREFLLGQQEIPVYRDLPISTMIDFWHRRWLTPRAARPDVMARVRAFEPERFSVLEPFSST